MLKVLKMGLLQQAEEVRKVYCVSPESGTTLEDVMKPEYWRAVTNILRPGTIIEVSAEDGTYFADLIVYDVGLAWAKVKLHHVSHHEPNGSAYVPWAATYVIGRALGADSGVVVRLISDNSIVGKFIDNEEAVRWMNAKLRG
jgi:hypothetical protein